MKINSSLVLKITVCFNDRVMDRWEETIDESQLKQLYPSLQQEYGKCNGKVYQDFTGCNPVHVGWTFKKKVIDAGFPVMQITWCHLHRQITQEYPVNLKTGKQKRLTKIRKPHVHRKTI